MNEVADGYDAIEWIARQPWSNGDVGMWGDSYYGFTQWAAVAVAAPGAQGDRPARHDRRHRLLARGRDAALRRALPGASTGPTRNTHEWTPDWSRRPLAEVFDDAFEAIGRRSASFDYVLARSRGARAGAALPGRRTRSTSCASRRCTAWAGSTTSRRRTCSTTRR